jgi:hypothetical protein
MPMKESLAAWKKSAGLAGYCGWEEIFVYSFFPDVLVTPHCHVLVRAEAGFELEQLLEIAQNVWRRLGLASTPDPMITEIRSDAHFQWILRYLKPVDLLTPYRSGYNVASARGEIPWLHQNVTHFLDGLAENRPEWHGDEKRAEKRPEKSQSSLNFLFGHMPWRVRRSRWCATCDPQHTGASRRY